jgi:hypothetical protein
MIAKRQTTLLMCGLTVIALILMPSSNQPTTNRRELQHVHARGLLLFGKNYLTERTLQVCQNYHFA